MTMQQRYRKSSAGREEIRVRQWPLSRTARNLLLVCDGTRPLAEWLTLVRGVTEEDVALLLQHGLLEPEPATTAPAARAAAPAPIAPQSPTEAPRPAAAAAPDDRADDGLLPSNFAALTRMPPAPSDAPGPESLPPSRLEADPVAFYNAVYTYITRHARNHLGLRKGYQFVLEVERVSGAQEMRALAQRYIAAVREAKGDSVARQVGQDMLA